MRVSQISSNNLYQNKIAKTKSIQQSYGVSFRNSYDEAFRKVYSTNYKSGDKVIEDIKELIRMAQHEYGPHIKNKYFKNLPYIYKNITSLNDILNKLYSNGKEIAEKYNKDFIYMTNKESITFCNPHDITENITLGIVDKEKKQMFLEQMNICSYDYYEFYNQWFSPISKHKHVSGNEMGRTSSTTRYNPDGSEKSFFDMLSDIFD